MLARIRILQNIKYGHKNMFLLYSFFSCPHVYSINVIFNLFGAFSVFALCYVTYTNHYRRRYS